MGLVEFIGTLRLVSSWFGRPGDFYPARTSAQGCLCRFWSLARFSGASEPGKQLLGNSHTVRAAVTLDCMLVACDSRLSHYWLFSLIETYVFSVQMLYNQACASILSALELGVG